MVLSKNNQYYLSHIPFLFTDYGKGVYGRFKYGNNYKFSGRVPLVWVAEELACGLLLVHNDIRRLCQNRNKLHQRVHGFVQLAFKKYVFFCCFFFRRRGGER